MQISCDESIFLNKQYKVSVFSSQCEALGERFCTVGHKIHNQGKVTPQRKPATDLVVSNRLYIFTALKMKCLV
jgi:hypothetical protein